MTLKQSDLSGRFRCPTQLQDPYKEEGSKRGSTGVTEGKKDTTGRCRLLWKEGVSSQRSWAVYKSWTRGKNTDLLQEISEKHRTLLTCWSQLVATHSIPSPPELSPHKLKGHQGCAGLPGQPQEIATPFLFPHIELNNLPLRFYQMLSSHLSNCFQTPASELR